MTVLGVSFDAVEDNRAFAEKFAFPFKLLSDPTRAMGLAYGACDDASAQAARRISYLIGKDGAIRAAWSKVSPKTHPEEVLGLL